jgi:hypothetical protein
VVADLGRTAWADLVLRPLHGQPPVVAHLEGLARVLVRYGAMLPRTLGLRWSIARRSTVDAAAVLRDDRTTPTSSAGAGSAAVPSRWPRPRRRHAPAS